jgi:hypothetical protein
LWLIDGGQLDVRERRWVGDHRGHYLDVDRERRILRPRSRDDARVQPFGTDL